MDRITLNNLPEGVIKGDSSFNDGLHLMIWPNGHEFQYEDAYDGGVLPEVTVTPADWLIDFINNFGNKELRNAFYDDFNNYRYTYKDDGPGVQYIDVNSPIVYLVGAYNVLNPHYGDVRNLSLAHNTYESYDNVHNINNLVRRLYNMWNLGGRPKVQFIKDNGIMDRTLNWLQDKMIKLRGSEYGMGTSDDPRPYTIPRFNTMYLGNDIVGDFIAELSHPILAKFGVKHGELTMNDNPELEYADPECYEYETHKVIEPMVHDYIYYNIMPDFIKSIPVITSYDDFK